MSISTYQSIATSIAKYQTITTRIKKIQSIGTSIAKLQNYRNKYCKISKVLHSFLKILKSIVIVISKFQSIAILCNTIGTTPTPLYRKALVRVAFTYMFLIYPWNSVFFNVECVLCRGKTCVMIRVMIVVCVCNDGFSDYWKMKYWVMACSSRGVVY